MHKEPKATKGSAKPGLEKVPNTQKESKYKNENNRVTQEGNEYAFEYNADKIDKEDSDN